MIDKVQRIREEVERLRNLHQMKYQQLDADNSMSLVECGKRNLCNELLSFIDSLQEEPVSNVWHDMSEEAENGRNIIIIDPKDFYGAVLRKGGSQLKNHNKERYAKWAYIDDIINITNKEEPVSEDLEEAAEQDVCEVVNTCSATRIPNDHIPSWVQDAMVNEFIHGAKWQKEKFEKECADMCNGIASLKGLLVSMTYRRGVADGKEQIMKDATEAIVKVDAGGYPYIPQIELYDYDNDVPLAKEGDKYKVILIKED